MNAATAIDRNGDSLAGVIAGSSAVQRQDFSRFSDSVLARVADSLNAPRKISLVNLRQRVSQAAVSLSDRHTIDIRSIAQRSHEGIISLADAAAECTGCSETENFDDRRESFLERCDSTRDAAFDVMSVRTEEAVESISQSYEMARDSIAELRDLLMEQEIEEREALADSLALEEERASRVTITMVYEDPMAFRGRDNGFRSSAVSPSIQYTHRSGFFAAISGSWLFNADSPWDVTATTAGYERSFGDSWFGSLAYTRLWFSSSSPQAKSVLDNSLDLDVGWGGALLTAGAHLSVAFSKTSESTLFLSVAAPLTVKEMGMRGTLTFEPGLTGVYGQQDATLNAARAQKSKKNVVVVAGKTTKVLSVMDYELKLPVRYTWESYAAAISYTAVLPLNVLDTSTSSLFGVLGLEVSITIR